LDLAVKKAPDFIDDDVARLKLKAMGIEIDSLSERQNEYLSNWQEGT
jgi:adenosylhomocysteinase